jgi:hypothetical protein
MLQTSPPLNFKNQKGATSVAPFFMEKDCIFSQNRLK